eukprot:4690038-Ditylum_brightwellii.AAC.1
MEESIHEDRDIEITTTQPKNRPITQPQRRENTGNIPTPQSKRQTPCKVEQTRDKDIRFFFLLATGSQHRKPQKRKKQPQDTKTTTEYFLTKDRPPDENGKIQQQIDAMFI